MFNVKDIKKVWLVLDTVCNIQLLTLEIYNYGMTVIMCSPCLKNTVVLKLEEELTYFNSK